MIRWALLAASMAAFSACSGGDDDGGSGGEVELGTGTLAWEPLADEAELTIIAGPQGGHHFIVHARIRDLEPGDQSVPGSEHNPTTGFFAYLADTGEQMDLGLPPYHLGYGDGDADGFSYLASGRLLILDDRAGVAQWYGQRVRLRVQVEDERGRRASDERIVIAVEDDNPPDGLADAGAVDASATMAP